MPVWNTSWSDLPAPAPDKTDKAPAAQTNPAALQTPAEEPKPKENSNVEEAAN